MTPEGTRERRKEGTKRSDVPYPKREEKRNREKKKRERETDNRHIASEYRAISLSLPRHRPFSFYFLHFPSYEPYICIYVEKRRYIYV